MPVEIGPGPGRRYFKLPPTVQCAPISLDITRNGTREAYGYGIERARARSKVAMEDGSLAGNIAHRIVGK
jgi:hypothetical protein